MDHSSVGAVGLAGPLAQTRSFDQDDLVYCLAYDASSRRNPVEDTVLYAAQDGHGAAFPLPVVSHTCPPIGPTCSIKGTKLLN